MKGGERMEAYIVGGLIGFAVGLALHGLLDKAFSRRETRREGG